MPEDYARKIIGVVGRKGGSGKTTSAVHVAAELHHRGRSVVLVDADLQGSAQHWAAPGRLPMKVQHMPLTSDVDIRTWSRTLRALATEFVLIDSAPHLDRGMGATVGIADLVLLPCGPSGLDVAALLETRDFVREARKSRGDHLPKILLLPTRVDTRTGSGRELETTLRTLGEEIAPPLHLRMAMSDAFNTGGWVGSYAPGSAAYAEVRKLTDHILKTLGEKPARKRG